MKIDNKELDKLKELLDNGVISQEEFEEAQRQMRIKKVKH